MEPSPSRLVAREAKNTLQPHRLEPQTQGLVRLMEDCASRDRNLPVARGAFHTIPGRVPGCSALTVRTQETLRPVNCHDIRFTICLCVKSIFLLRLRARIILRTRVFSHGPRIEEPELTGYPFAVKRVIRWEPDA